VYGQFDVHVVVHHAYISLGILTAPHYVMQTDWFYYKTGNYSWCSAISSASECNLQRTNPVTMVTMLSCFIARAQHHCLPWLPAKQGGTTKQITPYPYFSHKVLNFTLQFHHSLNFSRIWPLQTKRLCCSKLWVSVVYAVRMVLVAELKQNFLHLLSLSWNNVQQGCMNPGHQVAQAAKFCMMAPSICGSRIWNCLLYRLSGP